MNWWNWIYRRWFYGEDTPRTNSYSDLNNHVSCDDLDHSTDCIDLDDDGIYDNFEDTQPYDWSNDDDSNYDED